MFFKALIPGKGVLIKRFIQLRLSKGFPCLCQARHLHIKDKIPFMLISQWGGKTAFG